MHCKTCGAPSFQDPCARCRSLPKPPVVEVAPTQPDPLVRPTLPSLFARPEFKELFNLVEKLRSRNQNTPEWAFLESEIDQLAYANLRYLQALEKFNVEFTTASLKPSTEVEEPAVEKCGVVGPWGACQRDKHVGTRDHEVTLQFAEAVTAAPNMPTIEVVSDGG